MSPCDTCPRPGSCCKGFILSPLFSPANWEHDAPIRLEDNGLKFFRIVEAVRAPGDGMVAVRCECELVDDNGRCGNYEGRPELCRSFEPMSDPLCCLFVGPWPHAYPDHFAYPAGSDVTA